MNDVNSMTDIITNALISTAKETIPKQKNIVGLTKKCSMDHR